MKEKVKKKEIAKISVFITSIFVIFLSITYAFINLTLAGNKRQVITVGTLQLELEEDDEITIQNALPMYDEVGLIQDAFTFRLINKGNNAVNYILSLEDITEEETNKLSTFQVKYGLTRDSITKKGYLSTIEGIGYKLEEDTIEGNTTYNYELRLWVASEVTDNEDIKDKSLKYKIHIEASQEGAPKVCATVPDTAPNAPELTQGLIPVVYNETEKQWQVADISSNWYNYSKQEWANAVTVTSEKRSEYIDETGQIKTEAVGTEVPLTSMNAMFVWIPRYSYTIKQPYGSTGIKCKDLGEITVDSPTSCRKIKYSEEIKTEALNFCKQELDQQGEEITIEKECVEALSKKYGLPITTFEEFMDYGVASGDFEGERTVEEIYPENEVGAIDVKFVNKSVTEEGTAQYTECVENWRTPDGFTFGDEQLSGIWVGKFELSHKTLSSETNDNNLNCTNGNCTNANDLEILPNKTSLRNNNVSNFFYAIKSMQKQNNPFGFETDQNKMDVHMIKNSEWGVVAYLSQSKYGKYGNSKYEGAEKEVRINNCSTYTTGIGATNQDESSSSSTCDNPENQYDGEYGKSASTTGNITGVYDMSGGANEYVMGVLADDDNNPRSGFDSASNSGFNGKDKDGNQITGISFPEAKYYDLYKSTNPESENSDLSKTACNGGVCYGHALSETAIWYTDYSYFITFNYPWLQRGGYYYNDLGAGVFDFYSFIGGNADDTASSRAVFVPLGAS